MDIFMILQLSLRERLRRKWFSGENKERETILLQETQAEKVSYHF